MGDPTNKGGASALRTGAIGGMLTGAALFLLGLYSVVVTSAAPMPLAFTLIAVGFAGALSSFHTLRKRRFAWAFSTSINATLGAVGLLASPKLRDMLGTSLELSLLPAACLICVTTFLALGAVEIETR